MVPLDVARINLLEIIGHDTRLIRVARVRGRGLEYAGPCPACGGRDRFKVQPQGGSDGRGVWMCRSCTGPEDWRDAIAYIQWRGWATTFGEACTYLKLNHAGSPERTTPCLSAPEPCEPPSNMWQDRAEMLVDWAQRRLWGPEGRRALAWLTEVRRLSFRTILDAELGYIPETRWEGRDEWGLVPAASEHKTTSLCLLRAIVIPWRIEGRLWKIELRLPIGKTQIPGGSNALWNVDALVPGTNAILLEGVIDALTVQQTARGLVIPVATGSTGGARRVRWLAKLALCHLILIAYDNDPPGEQASHYWLNALGAGAWRWRPWWGDVNQLAQDGADVRAWVAAGIAVASSAQRAATPPAEESQLAP
jgi:DNA primase